MDEVAQKYKNRMNFVRHCFTPADLLNLGASPITLLPRPGSGKRYVAFLVFAYFKFLTTPYTLNGNTILTFSTGPYSIVSVALGGLIDQAEDRLTASTPIDTAGSGGGAFDQPLIANGIGELELSGGDGSLIVSVYYTIEKDQE